MKSSILGLLLFAIANFSCSRDISIVSTPIDGLPGGKIYFQSTDASGLATGLWMIDLSGADTTAQLVVPNLWQARLSFDKSRIAGHEFVNHGASITMFSPNGSYFGSFSLSEWPYIQFLDPSPNGSKVVASAARFAAGSPAVCVMSSDGTDFRVVSDTSEGPDGWPLVGMFPTWSPDGSRIAYLRYYEYSDSTKTVLTIISPDGTNARDLFQAYRLAVPMWSPNGKMVACFQEPRTNSIPAPFSVRVIDVASGASQYFVLVNSIPNPEYKSMTWSADGTLYCSGASGESEGGHSIFRISTNSTEVTEIANGFKLSTIICSPDGEYVAVLGNKGTDRFSLYIMKPDGSHFRLAMHLANSIDAGVPFGFRYGFWIAN